MFHPHKYIYAYVEHGKVFGSRSRKKHAASLGMDARFSSVSQRLAAAVECPPGSKGG